MKFVITLCICILSLKGTAQFNPVSPQFQQGLILGDSFFEEPSENFFPLNEFGISYVLLHSLGLDTMAPGTFLIGSTEGNKEVLFFSDHNNSIRPFYIVHQSEEFFLLCPKRVANFCDCKESINLFIPKKEYLEPVAKIGFTSLKEDLINKLKQFAELELNADEFKDYCTVLSYLQSKTKGI